MTKTIISWNVGTSDAAFYTKEYTTCNTWKADWKWELHKDL